jgi:hypothetical protein
VIMTWHCWHGLSNERQCQTIYARRVPCQPKSGPVSIVRFGLSIPNRDQTRRLESFEDRRSLQFALGHDNSYRGFTFHALGDQAFDATADQRPPDPPQVGCTAAAIMPTEQSGEKLALAVGERKPRRQNATNERLQVSALRFVQRGGPESIG